MYESDHRTFSPSQPNSFNLLLSLKEKKKQLLNCEKSIKQKIKQYYSDLTLILHDKETATLQQFDSKLCSVFENIDSFCAMTETDRYQNRIQIFKILGYKLDVTDDNMFKDAIKESILRIGFQDDESYRTTGLENIKTSKKGNQKNHQILKQAYLEEITYLQQKIEKLALKEDKIKARLAEMQSRQKMKKVGTSYLPYEEKPISNLLIERLESENKILINQIAESSEKILQLRSENSMLAKESHLMPTEKKKMCESINVIEQSMQLNHFQEKVAQLQSQIEQLKSEIESERNAAHLREQQFHLTNERVIEGYQQKIRDLTDYKERLQNQCDSLQSKKMELQSKLTQLQTKYADLNASFEVKCKENDNVKEMNNNYAKLLQIKEDKITDAQATIKKLQRNLKQSQDNYKATYVQNSQKLEAKQVVLKAKQAQIQSLKSVLKKQQSERSDMRQKMANVEEQLFATEEKIKTLETQITKATKQKESYAKKQVTKAKKQLKKSQQDEKAILVEDFKTKYGQFMQKLDSLKKEYNDNMERSDKKIKLYENRMQMLKDKVTFQTKQMLQKLSKPGQKQKLFSVIESYIQSEASLTMKTAQIKMLKEEIATLKKPANKKQNSKPTTQLEVISQLQQFEKKILLEKLEVQKQIYEARILQQKQELGLIIQQKQSHIQSLNTKIQSQQKSIKEIKSQLSNANSATNPEINQLKKMNDQMTERESKMQGLINGLKNNITKLNNELQQVKQELRLKKQLITGLKKQIKDKELEKSKLNETLTSLMQQSERLKRTSKQANKKEAIFSEFKQKLINQTQLSQEICQLKNSMEEKQKNYRIELNKKDQIIKQLKINEEITNKKLKTMNSLQEELFDLKQKIKKFKIEVDRKDTLIEHLKQKQQKALNQLTSTNENTQNELKRTRKQLQSQRSRAQSLKSKLNKIQSNYQLLKLSLIRIYEQVSQSSGIHKQYQTSTTKADGTNLKSRYEFTVQRSPEIDMNKYRQALSILEISSQDLELTSPIVPNYSKLTSQYNSPSINKMQTYNNASNFNQESIKLSRLLDSEDIDSKAIIEIFSYVLEP